MKLFRFFASVALFAALFLLIDTVSADCPEDDPRCTILPPVSQEVSSLKSEGSIATGAGDVSTLSHLDQVLPMPPPPLALTLAQSRSTRSSETLSLPMRLQDSTDPTCGTQALGMALDGLSGGAPSSYSLWKFLEDQGMTYDFGTGVEELAHAAQSFGYAGSLAFHDADLADLQAELAMGRPVVVSLGANGEGQPGHFVTLTGISPDGTWVSYNDPSLGIELVSIEEFMRLWGAQGNSGVRVAEEPLVTSEGELNAVPWVAMAAGLMALVSTTPMVLGRKGIGGRLDPNGASGGSTGGPHYPAPAGYHWSRKLVTRNKTVWEQDGWTYENRTVPRYERQRVQVGTTMVFDKIPKYKMVRVQDGWKTVLERVPEYKTVRYVKYYRTTTQKVKRYRYVHGRYVFAGYSTITKRTPVYGTKSIFNGYTKTSRRVPNYVEKRVPDGFKIIETEVPKYEWRDVKVGWTTEKVRVPKMVQVCKPDGVEVRWKLEKLPDPFSESPVEIKNENAAKVVPDAGQARSMVTTNPLKIRSDAGMEGIILCYALEGAPIYFTGDMKEIDGTTWFKIEYQDKYKGTIAGWVSSTYLREFPPPIQNSTNASDAPNLQNSPSYLWQHELSPQERAEYLVQEIEKFERLVAEIEKLLRKSLPGMHPNIPLGVEIDPMAGWRRWQEQVRQLIAEPEWIKSLSMPPNFAGQFGIPEKNMGALRIFMQGLSDLNLPITDMTFKVIGEAFGVGSADVLIQGLASGPDYWHGGLSAGDLPVTLRVHDRDGVRLRVYPTENSALVQGPFNGIPYHDTVEWLGTYSIGTDGKGDRRVYYQVTFEWIGHTYEGWVPSEYFSPPVEKESGKPVSSSAFRRTYGYDQEGGWAYYHAGGAAQNLNLWKIFEEIGYEFEEGVNPFPSVHHNLCGQLAVIEALGVSLEEGFVVFAGMGEIYQAILEYPMQETFATDLMKLIMEFEKTADVVLENRNLNNELKTGKKILALVSIHDGVVHTDGLIAHWVHVKRYDETSVSFYNPFSNREETVDTTEFNMAWKSTPGNANGYISIVASP